MLSTKYRISYYCDFGETDYLSSLIHELFLGFASTIGHFNRELLAGSLIITHAKFIALTKGIVVDHYVRAGI